MKLNIHIDSENDACRTQEDVLDILDKVRDKLRLSGTDTRHTILDANGQSVGWYSISQDDPDEDDEDSDDGESEDSDDSPLPFDSEDMELAGCAPITDEMLERAREARVDGFDT